MPTDATLGLTTLGSPTDENGVILKTANKASGEQKNHPKKPEGQPKPAGEGGKETEK